MRSIKRRFNRINKETKGSLSSLAVFATAIIGMGFDKRSMISNYDKLVKKSDYIGVPKEEMIDYLMRITKK